MGYEPQSRIGQRVKFKKYVRPFETVTGIIIGERKDLDEHRYHKPMRYIIKPDKPISEDYSGDIVRYHPEMKKELDKFGKPTDRWIKEVKFPEKTIEDVEFLENPI